MTQNTKTHEQEDAAWSNEQVKIYSWQCSPAGQIVQANQASAGVAVRWSRLADKRAQKVIYGLSQK